MITTFFIKRKSRWCGFVIRALQNQKTQLLSRDFVLKVLIKNIFDKRKSKRSLLRLSEVRAESCADVYKCGSARGEVPRLDTIPLRTQQLCEYG